MTHNHTSGCSKFRCSNNVVVSLKVTFSCLMSTLLNGYVLWLRHFGIPTQIYEFSIVVVRLKVKLNWALNETLTKPYRPAERSVFEKTNNKETYL